MKRLVQIGAGATAFLAIIAVLTWGPMVFAHLGVEPRVSILESKQSCELCIQMCMDRGGSDRDECLRECRDYQLCAVAQEED